ncbi:uncharacterized protein G2W53_039900 [Senna tora]|uniref:Uncharacterized protein n=1 Tax=Senna tora TaxID=362788 RepID=A0A834W8C5_9FABA|nr:uncharacterized protein G2W53_039900 [Senna tora]
MVESVNDLWKGLAQLGREIAIFSSPSCLKAE